MRTVVTESRAIKTDKAEKKSLVNLLGAVGGFVGGLILAFSGLILSLITFFSRIKFNRLELILIVAAFVFFATGAHFMDLIEKEKKAKMKQKLNL
jgi:cytochrome c biogenesis protein CcdA